MIFVPLWITFAYAVNAFLLWGGGYWAGKGALDFSGGYVIHLAAGVSGFVAAAVVGPRLKRDRERAIPNNLMFVAVGAGLLWLGWNGFNGGDPYFAGADAAAAVINTNLATAVAMMTWIIMDMAFSSEKKPTFLGALNGMICGLVGITPAAGYVNGLGAIVIGLVCSAIVWVAWTYLPKYVWPFNKVDDALGVVYTHGIAGLFGGLLVGLLADPKMIVYLGLGKNPSISGTGLFYGHGHQLLVQAEAALTIIIWDAAVTFVILMVIKHVFRMNLRLPDDQLEIGDVAVHGEEAYPSDELISVGSSMADEISSAKSDGKVPEKAAKLSADEVACPAPRPAPLLGLRCVRPQREPDARPGPRKRARTRDRLCQCPRKASSSHHEPCADVTLASMSSGRSRGPSSQPRTGARSAVSRTVSPSNPNPRPIAAISVGGNRTTSSGSPSGPKWCTSAP